MICLKCATAADLAEAGRAVLPDEPTVPTAWAVIVVSRAVTKLHTECVIGCTCQHHTDHRTGQS